MTIAWTWRGITLAANADRYLQYREECLAPSSRSAGGCTGFLILRECQGELVHFLLLSFWTSEQALESFTGHAPRQILQPCPAENNLVIAFEAIAGHYEVVSADERPILEIMSS